MSDDRTRRNNGIRLIGIVLMLLAIYLLVKM